MIYSQLDIKLGQFIEREIVIELENDLLYRSKEPIRS